MEQTSFRMQLVYMGAIPYFTGLFGNLMSNWINHKERLIVYFLIRETVDKKILQNAYKSKNLRPLAFILINSMFVFIITRAVKQLQF